MGKGIGDYIHLTAAGYNKYGIYRWSSKSASKGKKYSSEGVIQAEISKQKRMISSISNKTVQEMQDLLNLFYNNKISDKSQANRRQEIINHIEENLIKTFGNRLGKINWNTGEITASSLASQGEKIALLKNTIEDKIGKSDKRIDPQQVNIKIKQIDDFIAKNQKELKKQNVNIEQVTNKLNTVKQQMKKLYEDIDLTVNKELEFYDLPKIIGKDKHHTRTDEKNLREDLNEIIKLLGLAPPIALQQGELMELIVAYLPYFANQVSLEEIDKNLSTIKTGGNTLPVEYSPANFSFAGANAINLKKGNFSFEVKKASSQTKIDVQMKWGTDEVKASIKNYKLNDSQKKYIDTVKGSSFLFLIQDLDHTFVNHYLNLNVIHSKEKAYSQYYMKKQKASFNKEINNSKDAKESRATMKVLLSLKALSGVGFKREAVNVFIVNDNTTGEVKVIKINDLLDKIQILKASSLSVKTDTGISISNLKGFQNTPCVDRGGIERINNLLQELHKIKITAMINWANINPN